MTIVLTIAVCPVAVWFSALILFSCWRASKADERLQPVRLVSFDSDEGREALKRIHQFRPSWPWYRYQCSCWVLAKSGGAWRNVNEKGQL